MTDALSKHLPVVRRMMMSLIVPMAFFIGMLPLLRYFAPLEMDPDEGINVMKALLVARGFPLYQEIWSDQPPLFTYFLTANFHLFGFDILVARCSVLMLSCLLLWASWQFLNSLKGPAYAFLGCFLIALLPNYATLSISAMVGLPALTFAVTALWALARWHATRARFWLTLSALALSISVLTKAFTGFLIPIFIFGLLASEFSRPGTFNWGTRIGPAIIWGLIFVCTTAALLIFFVAPENLPQFFTTHLAARDTPELQQFSLMASLKASRYNQLILGLAALGSVLALRQKHWLVVYLIVWFGTAFVLLLNHAPVWYHHHLLVTIPAAMLAAYAVHEIIYLLLISACTKTFSPGRAVLFLLFVIVILPVATMQASNLLKFCLVSLQTVHTASYAEMSLAELQPVSLMSHYAGQSQWVVTDRPLYAFRAGLPVPPNFAVISLKRVATGSLTEQDVLDSIRKTSPEQVFLTRFQWPSVEEYLHDHYYILSSISGKPFYLRHDLAQETP